MASWVDISLVGSTEWISLLKTLLHSSLSASQLGAAVRTGIYTYLHGLATKGMGPGEKVDLITGMWNELSPLFFMDPLIASLHGSASMSNGLSEANKDQTFLDSLRAFAVFVDSVGLQLIDAYRSVFCLQSVLCVCVSS